MLGSRDSSFSFHFALKDVGESFQKSAEKLGNAVFPILFKEIKTFSNSRFRDTSSNFDASSKRYVITNPPDDFNLLSTDQVKKEGNFELFAFFSFFF